MPSQVIPRYRPIEFDRYITPDGNVYNFENAYDQFLISGISGQGLPPVNYRTQRGPFQDGVTPLGFVLGSRTVILTHRRNTGCRDEYWGARADFMNFIRPNRQVVGEFTPGTLRREEPNGAKRDLCVFILSGPDFIGTQQGRWDEFNFQEIITFVAHDPLFFDPDQQLLDLLLPASGDELDFPITFPIRFSSDGGVPLDTLTYNGTYKSFPIIIIQGPIKNPVITNVTTNERIELETTILTGRTVTINLGFGNKTVVDDLGTNLIGELTTDSDLAEWHIAADPEAPGGVNRIGTGGSGAGVPTRIAIQWFERFIGI